jgi:hypothetical protein
MGRIADPGALDEAAEGMQRSAVQILPELSTVPFVDSSAEQQG